MTQLEMNRYMRLSHCVIATVATQPSREAQQTVFNWTYVPTPCANNAPHSFKFVVQMLLLAFS